MIKRYITEVTFLDSGLSRLFSSVTAIFDYYTEEELGCSLDVLWAAQVSQGRVYRNHRVVIKKREVLGRVK